MEKGDHKTQVWQGNKRQTLPTLQFCWESLDYVFYEGKAEFSSNSLLGSNSSSAKY